MPHPIIILDFTLLRRNKQALIGYGAKHVPEAVCT
jgi:hypothetical protein